MKKTTFSIANFTVRIFILPTLLFLSIFAQNKETPQSAPETNKATRERKVETANKTNTTPTEPVEDYPEFSQPNLPPQVDYLKEAEEYQRQLESERQQQDTDAQKQMEELLRNSQIESNRQQKIQEQLAQQQKEQIERQAEEKRQAELEADQRDQAAQQFAAEQWKWFWLIPLFEILQTVGLSLIAFKKNVAKKSVLIMIIGLVCLLLITVDYTFQIGITVSIIGIVLGIVGVYGYVVGKLATYVIVSMLPEKLLTKLITVFSVGIALAALYILLSFKTGYGSIGMTFGFFVILTGVIVALVKTTKSNKEDFHGTARFADKNEIAEFEKPIEPGGFILAPVDPKGSHGKVTLPRSLSGMHGLILGGTGTGKSRGFFMPNCAEMKNTSIVVTDPKSELWLHTSGFHDNALRFAPSEPYASQCFNWIPLCTDARMSEHCARAIMTAGSTHNTDQFWIDSETAFLSAIFAHTAMTKNPTPLAAYQLFTRKKPEELLHLLLNSPSYVAREQATIFEQTDSRIKGAIVPAVASRMQFMRDPNIQLFTSAKPDAPNFGELRHMPTAIYWCLREQDVVRLRPLTSLFFTVLLEQIAAEEVHEGAKRVPINLMLDEFANIGKIPDFETTISLARGRDVALWLGIQSLSQLNQTYGNHAAQTIMSNCATKIALHGLDYQTAEYVSKMLGEKTVMHRRGSFGFGAGGFSVGSSGAEHRRQLLTADEVMRIEENESIIRVSNKYPMKFFKGYYDEEMNTAPINFSLTEIYGEKETSESEEVLM